MKPLLYKLDVTAENVGPVDGTTRDTWEATAEIRVPGRSGDVGPVGRGRGKRPEVAINRAVAHAFERYRRPKLIEILPETAP